MKCNLCPRQCNAERTATENIGGFCRMPEKPTLARAGLHFWEEPSISGKNGSGTVFFSGCSLSCVYCQNARISQENYGKTVTAERLAEIFKELEKKGAHNINLVSPTHYVNSIIDAFSIYKPSIPIVYNSSGYENADTLKRLEDYVDIYLFDLKYLSSDRALLYSGAADYPEIAKNAILEGYRQKGRAVFENGLMQSGVIVRHLLLPQGTEEAKNVFLWVKENAPRAYFSLMSQYVPMGKAKDMKIINRHITKREYEKVVDFILECGFENCYIQELSSATKEYIPDFDLTGI